MPEAWRKIDFLEKYKVEFLRSEGVEIYNKFVTCSAIFLHINLNLLLARFFHQRQAAIIT
jgi:hypothetical protein